MNQSGAKTLINEVKNQLDIKINNDLTVVYGNTNGCTSKSNCAKSAQCINPSQ